MSVSSLAGGPYSVPVRLGVDDIALLIVRVSGKPSGAPIGWGERETPGETLKRSQARDPPGSAGQIVASPERKQ